MSDAELFLWYLDVPFREALRQQRQHLRTQGRQHDAEKTARLIIDPASCHVAGSRGEGLRREQLCDELNLKIKDAPAGYSAEGQPCDQIHHSIQCKQDRHMEEIVGEQPDIFKRPEEYALTAAGNLKSIGALVEVEGDVRAIRALTKEEWAYSWYVSGYVPAETYIDDYGLTFGKRARRSDPMGNDSGSAALAASYVPAARRSDPLAASAMAGSLSVAPPASKS